MTQRLTDQAKQPGADSMRPIRMATTLLWWSGRVRNRLLWLLYGRTMRYEYDKANDVAYVRLKAGKVARTQALDDRRLVDYDSAGQAIGVEFIGVRGGVETDDLPNQEAVAKLLSKHKVKVKAYA
jgi:uncharacterized protein YuzE